MAKTGIRQEAKEKFVLTAEVALKEIRNLRAGKLFVSNMQYVDFLLAEFDHIVAASQLLNDMFKLADGEAVRLRGDLSVANLRIASLEGEIEQIRKLTTLTLTTANNTNT